MKRGKISIDRERCKGCYLCLASCPQKVIGISADKNSKGIYPAEYKEESVEFKKTCIACGSCYLVCPDTAIEVYEIKGGIL
ncbi:MAG TPA: 4Fe-4S dicluster domain-containing protein [Treponemataceae bacterium]|nr:4Fe-4S dicluster domain-containing protein [Treponemataceae bacterium]